MNKKILVLILVLLGVLMLNLFFGSVQLSWNELFDGNENTSKIILITRLKRSLIALLVGGGAAVSGLIYQTVFRNPLAGPTTLGVTSGASFGVVLSLVLGVQFSFLFGFDLMFFALIISFVFLWVLYSFYKKFNSVSMVLIIGLLLSYFSFAFIEILLQYSSDMDVKKYVFWGMGNFNIGSWSMIFILLFHSVFGVYYLMKKSEFLNLYLLGEDELVLEGINSGKLILGLVAVASIWICLNTSFVGPIAFVGIIVPNLLKRILKTSNHKVLLPLVFIGGSIFCLLADVLSRGALIPIVLPVNALLSIFGAPFIIYFLLTKRHEY